MLYRSALLDLVLILHRLNLVKPRVVFMYLACYMYGPFPVEQLSTNKEIPVVKLAKFIIFCLNTKKSIELFSWYCIQT